ncbi:MAG: glycosyltransferase family 9 protein [Ruminococcus sp.]
MKNVSVLGFIYAISKLKLLVGIDSSGGHIAACYKVPSITVWGKQTPEYFYNIGIKQENLKHNKISYRPLRKNISIWSKDRCIEKVGFKIVFDKMLEVINGGVNLSEDVLDYDNHSNCFIME